jgi:hypothetical protein
MDKTTKYYNSNIFEFEEENVLSVSKKRERK